MDNFRGFDKEQKQNWLKGVGALGYLQKPLEHSIEEIGYVHREFGSEIDFNSWKPRPKQIPPLDCEVWSRWRDVIWPNHTSQHGKVYMPDGHKNHNSVGDFDIAARLRLMRQCKYFKKFELGGLIDKVSNVRNKIMHALRYQLEQKDLHDYFNRIRELGEKLARYVPQFKNLSEDIDEIQNLDFRLILPDDIAAQTNRAQDEKELEDIYFALAQEGAEHRVTRVELEKLKTQIAQQEQDNLTDYYALTHKPRGLCVIINNEKFLGTELKDRRGSQKDERALRTVFTHLGFKVVTHNNLTAGAMRPTTAGLKELLG